MENHLKRILALVRKTGDTIIVVDKDGHESFVVMNIDKYEMLLDKPIGIEATPGDQALSPDIWDVMPAAGEEAQTWDTDALNDQEMGDLERQYKEFAGQHVKDATVETKKNPEKSREDEYGEEQFYLEPVE